LAAPELIALLGLFEIRPVVGEPREDAELAPLVARAPAAQTWLAEGWAGDRFALEMRLSARLVAVARREALTAEIERS
jgi:hypothetical protein